MSVRARPIAYTLRARALPPRDFGAASGPFAAFQLLRELKTLAPRVRQHNENAARVADFLSGRREVTYTNGPLQ